MQNDQTSPAARDLDAWTLAILAAEDAAYMRDQFLARRGERLQDDDHTLFLHAVGFVFEPDALDDKVLLDLAALSHELDDDQDDDRGYEACRDAIFGAFAHGCGGPSRFHHDVTFGLLRAVGGGDLSVDAAKRIRDRVFQARWDELGREMRA